MPSFVWSAPSGAMAEIVNTCPLTRPRRLSLARISTLSPGATSIRRERATSNESRAAQIESFLFPRSKGDYHFRLFYAHYGCRGGGSIGCWRERYDLSRFISAPIPLLLIRSSGAIRAP